MTHLLLFSILFFPLMQYAHAESALAQIKRKSVLVVAMLKQDLPPFIKTSGKKMEGIDIQLAEKIAHELGVALIIDRNSDTPDELVDKVATGKADMGLSAVSVTTKRAERVQYASPYIFLKQCFLLNRKSFLVHKQHQQTTLREFFRKDNPIGVLEGSAYEFHARALFPNAPLVLYNLESYEKQALKDLSSGKISGLFTDDFQCRLLLKKNKHNIVQYAAICLKKSSDPLSIIVDKDAFELRNWLNIFLKLHRISYTSKKLVKIYDALLAKNK